MIPDNWRIPIFAGIVIIMVVVVLTTFGLPGSGSSGGSARSADDIKKTEFIEVDFDLAELVKNVQEVDFSYSEVRQTRNPMTPLATIGTEFGGGDPFEGSGEPGGPGRISPIYEANRKELKGILWNPRKPMAVVTDRSGVDKVVTEGYVFEEGIVVKKITVDSITLVVFLEGEELEIKRQLLREEEQ